MLKRAAIFLAVLVVGSVLAARVHRSFVEVFVREAAFPLADRVEAEFETRLDAEYRVILAFRESEELKRARAETTGGDAYERSANIGRYLLDGLDVKLSGITVEPTTFRKTFSVFGGASIYENTSLEWAPHESYLVATFRGEANKRYRLVIVQSVNAGSVKGQSVPAYIMVRKN